ncbi:hypothetical protein, partial [Pseudomonas fragi]|uniref:hypothetical protein n=1 Tax=Pseudomonas fragi TaxID=296 RepID=UPI001CB73F34
AEALGMTDLNGGALFNAEFGIRHRGSTVPERSGVALSFCRRPLYYYRFVVYDNINYFIVPENNSWDSVS